MKEDEVLIDEETLQNKITEIANKIMEDYKDEKIVFICILKGSIFFTIDLAKRIKNNIEFQFMKARSYGENTVSSGHVEIELEIKDSLEGKHVIVIEDIIDTGHTLSFILEYLKEKKPKSLKLCALLDKEERREVKIDIDYLGFKIPNEFIVGYGLDFNEDYRNLPYIGYIK